MSPTVVGITLVALGLTLLALTGLRAPALAVLATGWLLLLSGVIKTSRRSEQEGRS